MSEESTMGTQRETGCDRCDEVNLGNASNGIMQMVSCEHNNISSLEEALELVQDDIEKREGW